MLSLHAFVRVRVCFIVKLPCEPDEKKNAHHCEEPLEERQEKYKKKRLIRKEREEKRKVKKISVEFFNQQGEELSFSLSEKCFVCE